MAIPSKEPRSVRPVESHESAPAPNRPGIEQLREMAESAWELLERQRRGFLAVAGATAVLLLLAILMQTPLYESSSLMLVKFGRELVYQPEVGTEQAVVPRDKQSVINSELAIARSRPVLESALRTVGLGAVFPGLGEALAELQAGDGEEAGDEAEAEAAAAAARGAETLLYAEGVVRLETSVSAQALPEADVVRVSYAHPDPLVAADFVNAMVDSFLEAHLTAFGEPKVASFLEQRVQEYQVRLDASESKLLEFESEHAAFALENPQTALVQWREAARAELTELDRQMAAIRLRHMQEDATVSEARNQLLQLEVEASQLDGELLEETRKRIAVVRRFIAQRKNAMGSELASLEAKKAEVRTELERTIAELKQMPTLSARYRALVRQRDADEEQYRTYARRLRDARLSSEMDREKIASINVIEPASPSPRPTWPPRKAVTLPVALVLSLLAGSLAALLLDRIGPTGIAWLDGTDGEAARR